MSTPHIHIGDITKLEVDAIVNAANESLAPGGGVCGAIHRAAGSELARACASIGGCPTGSARVTPGFDLPARFVIHAVGPVYQGGVRGEAQLLASCYDASLELAADLDLESIAFPCISTGIFAYPREDAARIALERITEWLAAHDAPGEVTVCCFSEDDVRVYHEIMNEP